ncbi:GlsB/YeaQ/YmgE family stress response membrane protein [Rhodohalobacter sulfatireducens]|uniref:GlsB/YeaQ/YmgE family stress response membrane protein n=1 Tax=Rhodohalobacter sulfatireducens TaxID=2911366 RepID=A0ABS9KD18_9BACT|nr:GlsB/YeaQ/YmgE family stress response membrane protein [Rhodohalobacter sulfatireducens]MCG2588752.1 GlsB/YeaQ/YmgE family stress response membrane protein [Rhodohalobacter sulfatireducens]MDR9365773.1 GlsB/YeaQ/YmgE family stress response membrane protein [Balneolaceae bacterium]MDR9410944.1 GlsB/YeaQ/YmgE family stress response membrane protein [Balneolaceae bacterium]
MGLIEFLLLLLIAGICGSIGQAIAGYSRGGCVVSIVVGFIGALLGSWLSTQLGLPEIFSIEVGGRQFPIIWSIIGSVVFVVVVGLLTGRK